MLTGTLHAKGVVAEEGALVVKDLDVVNFAGHPDLGDNTAGGNEEANIE